MPESGRTEATMTHRATGRRASQRRGSTTPSGRVRLQHHGAAVAACLVFLLDAGIADAVIMLPPCRSVRLANRLIRQVSAALRQMVMQGA